MVPALMEFKFRRRDRLTNTINKHTNVISGLKIISMQVVIEALAIDDVTRGEHVELEEAKFPNNFKILGAELEENEERKATGVEVGQERSEL